MITTAKIKTDGKTYHVASVYLPSNAGERRTTIESLITNGWVTPNTILEADHNMVEDEGKETEGRAPYDNAGHQRWFGHIASKGLTDAEREEAGPRAHLYTRRGNTRKSRLDKFVMPEARAFHDGWQWKARNTPLRFRATTTS